MGKFEGWALPALVTSLGSHGLGLRRNLAGLLSSFRLRFFPRQARVLVFEERGYPLPMCGVGGFLGRVLLCIGNAILLTRKGIESLWVFHLVLVPFVPGRER